MMDRKEFEAVIKQLPHIRYEYFIKKVVDFEEVWGLYNNGWATSQDEKGNSLIPFFPKSEFAEDCAKNEWSGYIAKPIELNNFIDKWLTGMDSDGIRPSIFPTDADTAVVEIDVILRDLLTELEIY